MKSPTSHKEVFLKISVLKNFATFTGKHLRWSLFLIKSQACRLQQYDTYVSMLVTITLSSLLTFIWDHPFSTYETFSEKLTFVTPLSDVSLSENFAYVLNRWSYFVMILLAQSNNTSCNYDIRQTTDFWIKCILQEW